MFSMSNRSWLQPYKDHLTVWLRCLTKLCKLESENKESVIAGDMNYNLMKEGDNDTKHIKHICNSFGYTQLVENAARTTVDTET